MIRPCLRFVLPLASALVLLPVASAAEPTAEQAEFFEKKVRPILVDTCQECHGAKKQRGGLRLDSQAALLKGGDSGPTIIPGDPEKSRLVRAIRYTDVELRMPKRGKLPDQQIADLTEWVRLGAPWPGNAGATTNTGTAFNFKERLSHWCWQPLKPLTVPAVKNTTWVRNPVDAFILAKLEAAGLAPTKPADKRTLLRRVTFDLIGLPPTPEELDAFVKDESPDAYEKVVDRLLASPHYGERWARHWLDLVRYAETRGHEFDFDIPEGWRYRDYVIRALNADLPYNRFVTEHVAGDLIAEPRRHATERFNESILGTGFWFLGEGKHSPVDIRLDGNERIDNQIDVFGKTFLGLTIACARCHDHKFDAIYTKDYYALAGYLRSSRFQQAFIGDPEPVRKIVRQIEEVDVQARALAMKPASKAVRTLAGKLEKCLLVARDPAAVAKEDPDAMTLDLWTKAQRQIDAGRAEHALHPWLVLGGLTKSEEFTTRRRELLKRLKELSAGQQDKTAQVVFEDFASPDYRGWYATGEAFGSGPAAASDLLLQPDARLPIRGLLGPGVARSDRMSRKLQGALRSRSFTIERDRIWYHIGGQQATVNLIIDGFQLIRAPIYGGLTFTVNTGDRFEWRVMDVSMWKGHRAYVELLDDGPGFVALDRVAFSDGGPPAAAPNPLIVELLADDTLTTSESLARKYQELFASVAERWGEGKLSSRAEAELVSWFLHGELRMALASVADALSEEDMAKLADMQDRRRKLEASIPAPLRVPAMADGTGENERVHIRGNHKNLGPEAPRQLLTALGGEKQPSPSSGSGRLELAQRMTDPAVNPLLPRVMVNRLWQHHFGEGIVRSVDNFGVLGETPSHPELLDWLGSQFVQEGWSLKKMHRLMVLSNTYRMASKADDAKVDEKDPQNRLWHRMPVRRLEAESIRDAMLTVSGRLDRKMYGPGVMPHLTPFMDGRGRPGVSGPLDGDGRRSVYLAVRRNFLNPMFLAFDYPIPFSTMGRRTVSNVPAQALTLLNNPFVVQQAQLWAKRALAEPGPTTEERVRRLYVSAFGRSPSEGELADALAFLAEQAKTYGKPDDPRAWTDLCHVLFNVKEFIFVG